MLIVAVIFSLLGVVFGTRYPISLFLCVFFGVSFLSAWLIGHELIVTDWLDLFNFSFTLLGLVIFSFIFSTYKKNKRFLECNDKYFTVFGYLMFAILIPALAINLIIINESISYVTSGNVNITRFKNQGEAAVLIRQWVNPFFVFYAYLFSGLGVVALAYHFYFLSVNKYALSLIFFILSLNLPLAGLHALSRASVAQYVLMYACVYFYVSSSLSASVKKRINRCAFFVFSLLFLFFLYITSQRFSESGFYTVRQGSYIDNIVLYSILDYLSQWTINGLVVLERFSLSDLWYGKSSRSLIDYTIVKFGGSLESYVDLRNSTLGEYGSRFNGIIATLIYDFSHIGVLLFFLFYFLIAKMFSPKRAGIDVYRLPGLCFIVSIPLLFFSNNFLSYEVFSLSGFYAFAFFALRKIKFR